MEIRLWRELLVPYELAEGITQSRKAVKEAAKASSVGIFIGPEGGFDEKEVSMLQNIGGAIVTLGHRILRTETAGPAVLTALMLHLEE